MKYAGELLRNKSWINLGPTMWLHIIYEIGTQIHLDHTLNKLSQAQFLVICIIFTFHGLVLRAFEQDIGCYQSCCHCSLHWPQKMLPI